MLVILGIGVLLITYLPIPHHRARHPLRRRMKPAGGFQPLVLWYPRVPNWTRQERTPMRSLTTILALMLAVLLPGAVPAQEEAESSENQSKLNAGTFSGLALRGIGPALMSGRIADVAIHPRGPERLVRGGGLGRRLEDHQRRHHLRPDLRQRGLLLDRLRRDRSKPARDRLGGHRRERERTPRGATATASTGASTAARRGRTWASPTPSTSA